MSDSRRFLGDLDAEMDEKFGDHFIEPPVLERIRSTSSNIIFGSKGSGKTAIRRGLVEMNRENYFATKTVDLDEISFDQVHAALEQLNETTQTELSTLASNTWRNVLALHCLDAVAGTLQKQSGLTQEIANLLASEKFHPDDTNPLVSQIERFLRRIVGLGLESKEKTVLPLSQEQRGVATSFPLNPGVTRLLESCNDIIAKSGKRVLVCIDGFDSIVGHTPASRLAIFSGLIDAVQKLSRDRLLSQTFSFKAFLPQELADNAQSVVWDSDKYILNTHYLKWSTTGIERFIMKRFLPYSRKKSGQFPVVWHEFMPEKVPNSHYKTAEDSLAYILRHTLYRPRQILIHLQRILDEWDETSNSFRVDTSFIPRVVADTNLVLATSVVNQLEVTHPGTEAFMQSWSGSPNILNVGKFAERIRRTYGVQDPSDFNEIFDYLYNFGVFGIVPRGGAANVSGAARSSKASFQFAFVQGRYIRNVHTSVEDSALLAFSPMFHEYCGCVPVGDSPIVPAGIGD